MVGERPLEPRGRRGGSWSPRPDLGLARLPLPAPFLPCALLGGPGSVLSYLQVNFVTFLEASVWKLEKSVTVSS